MTSCRGAPRSSGAGDFFYETRVHFYIVGFNLYHAHMSDPSMRGYRWLNLRKLGESIISSKEQLAAIYYFNAFYPGDTAKTARHKTFIQSQNLVGVVPTG